MPLRHLRPFRRRHANPQTARMDWKGTAALRPLSRKVRLALRPFTRGSVPKLDRGLDLELEEAYGCEGTLLCPRLFVLQHQSFDIFVAEF